MRTNALYTDLSGYYDLMCLDIDYQSQSNCVRRHDYEKLTPWDQNSGNAIITCVKKAAH